MPTATATKPKSAARKKPVGKQETDRDLSATYNEFKVFEGQLYTGAKVGRHQKWYYDQGEWREQKVAPDRWEFTYAVPKRRAGKAPEGSGVPVGTEYHWFIVAHQNVRKLDANDYSTAMTGLKYKIAHKRADKDTWSASDRAQRRRLVKILKEIIAELEKEPEEQPSEDFEPLTTSGDGERAENGVPVEKKQAPVQRKKRTAAKV